MRYLSLLTAVLLILFSFTGCSSTGGSSGTTGAISASAGSLSSPAASSGASAGITGLTVKYGSEDMDGSWDASAATTITLNGSSITVNGAGASAKGSILSITAAGAYVFSGVLTDGQIIVEAGEKDTVRLVLNGATVSCSDSAPIYSKQAKKTILTLAEGSNNTVQDGANYTYAAGEDEPDAAIFSKGDLTINGSGSLTVKGNANNGIGTKDDLIITGGNLTVTAANDGLRGRDSISVNGGAFTIESGGDGLQANNDEDTDKGWISLDGGDFTITAGNDGIQAATILQVTGGKFALTTGGGSVNASTGNNVEAPAGWGQWKSPTANNTIKEDTVSAKGLKAVAGILIKGGVFSIDTSDDSIHSNGEVLIKAGEFTISSGDDGIHADSALTVDGGSINIKKSYEGIESAAITINDGTIRLTAQDDGFNAAGGNDGSSLGGRPGQNSFNSDGSNYISITGGYISVTADGDGIDANGALYFKGGTVLVNGPTNNGNGAMDYDGTCEITGGVLVAAGSSGMAQAPGNTSAQNSLIVFYSSMQKAGTLVTLADEKGNSILTFAPSKDYQSIVISTPKLEQGKTYTLISGGTSSGQLTDGLYTGGAISGGIKLTDIKISGTVTSIADDGSQVSGGMRGMGGQGGPGGPRQPGGNQKPPGGPQTSAQ